MAWSKCYLFLVLPLIFNEFLILFMSFYELCKPEYITLSTRHIGCPGCFLAELALPQLRPALWHQRDSWLPPVRGHAAHAGQHRRCKRLRAAARPACQDSCHGVLPFLLFLPLETWNCRKVEALKLCNAVCPSGSTR